MGEPTKVSNKTHFTACRPEVLRLLEEQAEEGREQEGGQMGNAGGQVGKPQDSGSLIPTFLV